jgi:hypothetical protein
MGAVAKNGEPFAGHAILTGSCMTRYAPDWGFHGSAPYFELIFERPLT